MNLNNRELRTAFFDFFAKNTSPKMPKNTVYVQPVQPKVRPQSLQVKK